MTNETVEHKRIKEIVLNKLKEFCAAGLTEYPHSGNVNDVHLVTSDNIDIFTENVWTSTKSNFYRHMTILQRSPADAKILIVNPQILRDSHLQREFEKTKISETKRGIAVADLIDGSLTLES
jgi:hypothetical protein